MNIAPLHRLINEQSSVVTAIKDSTSAITLLSANPDRRMALFFNDSSATLYLKFGTGASTTNFTMKIPAHSFWRMPLSVYSGVVSGVWDSAPGGHVLVTEIT
jgi:hypothetical protein